MKGNTIVNEQKKQQEHFVAAGDAPKMTSSEAVVLFDPRDGRVVHVHHSIVLEGGTRSEPEEMCRRAVTHARGLGCATDGLETLHVADYVPSPTPLVVDVGRRVLVRLPLPAGVRGRLLRG